MVKQTIQIIVMLQDITDTDRNREFWIASRTKKFVYSSCMWCTIKIIIIERHKPLKKPQCGNIETQAQKTLSNQLGILSEIIRTRKCLAFSNFKAWWCNASWSIAIFCQDNCTTFSKESVIKVSQLWKILKYWTSGHSVGGQYLSKQHWSNVNNTP